MGAVGNDIALAAPANSIFSHVRRGRNHAAAISSTMSRSGSSGSSTLPILSQKAQGKESGSSQLSSGAAPFSSMAVGKGFAGMQLKPAYTQPYIAAVPSYRPTGMLP